MQCKNKTTNLKQSLGVIVILALLLVEIILSSIFI